MILITGGAGFVGSHVCRMLVEAGEKVTIFDNLSQGNMETLKKVRLNDIFDKIKILSGDITNPANVSDAIRNTAAERIIHAAAITFIPTAIKNPELTFRVNTMGTFNLLESARQNKIKKFVYISTASTYGDFKYTPADEAHPLEPKDIYGATKLAGDRLAIGYYRTYGLPVAILRISSVYGPGDLEKRAAKNFIENALQGLPMELQGGGTQRRIFSYVKDAARGIVMAEQSDKSSGEVFNISGKKDSSVKELAETIQSMIPGAEIKETGAREIDTKRGLLDITKAKRILGYEPRYDLNEGIKEYIKWVVNCYAPVFKLNIRNMPIKGVI